MNDKRPARIKIIALIIFSIALIIMGIAGGRVRDTQNKGSGICLECIGLG